MVDTISPSSSGESARKAQLEAELLLGTEGHDAQAYRRVVAAGRRAQERLRAEKAETAARPKAAAESQPETEATPGLQRDGSSESFEEEEMDPSVPFDHGLGIHGKAPPAAWVQARALPQ